MNKILSITEVEYLKFNEGWSDFDGYKVVTEQEEILCLIHNGRNCCEVWGYFSSPDDPSDFIGAELRDVKVVDDALDVLDIPPDVGVYGNIQFVTFETSRGDFQLAVYNEHNGYYGHQVKILRGAQTLCDNVI